MRRAIPTQKKALARTARGIASDAIASGEPLLAGLAGGWRVDSALKMIKVDVDGGHRTVH